MKAMTSKMVRRIGLGLLIALPSVGLVVCRWVIPAAIVAAIRQRHEGHVAISGWWIDGSSAGVTGLVLHEQPEASSPTWAAAERVATDLSVGALLRGRFTPRRIVFDRVSVSFRINAEGDNLTRIPLKASGDGAIPEMVVHDGELAMRQEGRPEMVVRHLEGTLGPDPNGSAFTARADDPDWGHPGIEGRFAADFSGYTFHLTADHLPADPERARRVPFVAATIWKYIEPRGPIGVVLDCSRRPARPGGDAGAEGAGVKGTTELTTTVTFQGTTVGLPTLGLTGEDATGPLTVRDKIVRLDDVRGRMAGGRVKFSGPIDLQHKPDTYKLALELDGVDLTRLPESWQLHRFGVRGRFSGTAGLHLVLRPDGIDMTGTAGDGVIDDAAIRGIPLKRLELALRGEGLRRSDHRGPGNARAAGKEGPFLPQWIHGEFRVNDVELENALARPETPRHPQGTRTIPVSGRLGLQATARLPLGSLDDWKAYQAHGAAELAAASIGELHLGRLKGRLAMSDGVLEISDLRGRLVDRPAGGGRPPATEPPPARGPLPRGGFRGRVRAALVGDQDIHAEFEGVELPIAELVAAGASSAFAGSASSSSLPPPSALPPTSPLPPSRPGRPVSGRLTIQASGQAKGVAPSDPAAWTASGRARIPEVAYRHTIARDVSASLAVANGRLVLSDLSGRLGDASFRGRLGLELKAPYAYDGELETSDLPCRELLGLSGHDPQGTKIEGTIAGRGQAKGTLAPRTLVTTGRAKVADMKVGRVPVGDVPVRWETKGETILVTAEEHQRYGGRATAEARLPAGGDGPIEGTMTLVKVDVAELSAGVGADDSWKLTGHADGRGTFRYAPDAAGTSGDSLPLEAEAHFAAPDLKVGGIPARSARLALTMHEGNPRFDLAAEGLGGKLRVTGDGHLATESKDDEFRAQFEALGLRLYEVWTALGTTGALAELRARVSVKGHSQLRGGLDPALARGEAAVELEEPIWGYDYILGRKVQARVSKSPDGWRVGPLSGELFGGKLAGDGMWMYRDASGRTRYGVDARLEQLELARALSFLPEADRRFAGRCSLRIANRPDGTSGGPVEFRIGRGQVNGLQLTALRLPGEWSISPGPPWRGELHLRRADGQIGGGRIGGEAHFTTGDRHDFRARLIVDDVDLRVISREELGSRPVVGRLSGYFHVYGTDPANLTSYRGDLDFDLEQASLVDIPLLDELDRQLGSTQGGIFDDGDLHGTIADRKLHIDYLTLAGPLAQVHARGTMDFDGRLNLEVVVNNNRGVYESGQAIMARAPNVADEVARRAARIEQVRDFVSSRLMKFRITGTIHDPNVNIDRSINPGAAVGFFLKAMRLSAQSR